MRKAASVALVLPVAILAGCSLPGQKITTDDMSNVSIDSSGAGSGQGLRRGGRQGFEGQRPQMDLLVAAQKLGVTEEALQSAMDAARAAAPTGEPQKMTNVQPPVPGQFRARVDLQIAADQLGVSLEDLQNALGLNGFGGLRGATPSAQGTGSNE